MLDEHARRYVAFLGEAALAVASEISYKFHPYRFAGGFDADSRFAEEADVNPNTECPDHHGKS